VQPADAISNLLLQDEHPAPIGIGVGGGGEGGGAGPGTEGVMIGVGKGPGSVCTGTGAGAGGVGPGNTCPDPAHVQLNLSGQSHPEKASLNNVPAGQGTYVPGIPEVQ
jgi:hypothetical protein